MKLIPQGEYVLIKPLSDDVVYAGTIHLPDTAKAKANSGTVLAKGEWAEQVSIGDWVIYSRKQAEDFTTDEGEELVFIRERGIILVLEDG